jgi:hypothetical protein
LTRGGFIRLGAGRVEVGDPLVKLASNLVADERLESGGQICARCHAAQAPIIRQPFVIMSAPGHMLPSTVMLLALKSRGYRRHRRQHTTPDEFRFNN